jgi:hypothetical protein
MQAPSCPLRNDRKKCHASSGFFTWIQKIRLIVPTHSLHSTLHSLSVCAQPLLWLWRTNRYLRWEHSAYRCDYKTYMQERPVVFTITAYLFRHLQVQTSWETLHNSWEKEDGQGISNAYIMSADRSEGNNLEESKSPMGEYYANWRGQTPLGGHSWTW